MFAKHFRKKLGNHKYPTVVDQILKAVQILQTVVRLFLKASTWWYFMMYCVSIRSQQVRNTVLWSYQWWKVISVCVCKGETQSSDHTISKFCNDISCFVDTHVKPRECNTRRSGQTAFAHSTVLVWTKQQIVVRKKIVWLFFIRFVWSFFMSRWHEKTRK